MKRFRRRFEEIVEVDLNHEDLDEYIAIALIFDVQYKDLDVQ